MIKTIKNQRSEIKEKVKNQFKKQNELFDPSVENLPQKQKIFLNRQETEEMIGVIIQAKSKKK